MVESKQVPLAALSAAQIASFQEQGFLSVAQISPVEEVTALRETLHRLFADQAGRKEGAQFDMVTRDDDGAPPKLSQIINPVNYAPELRHTHFRAQALALARQLLGPTAGPAFEHAILKPAGYGACTPWHQDEAFRDEAFDYCQLSIWMPLQDATLDNGCMQYIPGSNRGEILEHRSPGNDPKIHALVCSGDFDDAMAVPCPLAAGGAVIHQGRTLHYAGPNQSSGPRLAYVLAFETPPQLATVRRPRPWMHEKQTAGLQRRQQWRLRGGVAIVVWRKLRSGVWRAPGRLAFQARALQQSFWRRAAKVFNRRPAPEPPVAGITAPADRT